MSNAVFPALAGLTFEIKATPTWWTVVQRSKNRARTALLNDPCPLWKYELTYEFLAGPGSPILPPRVTPSNPEGYADSEDVFPVWERAVRWRESQVVGRLARRCKRLPGRGSPPTHG